jgi:hypothetical protein
MRLASASCVFSTHGWAVSEGEDWRREEKERCEECAGDAGRPTALLANMKSLQI